MALRELASCEGGNCPAVFLNDDGDVVVRGKLLGTSLRGQITFSDDEDGVVIPGWLLRKAATEMGGSA